MKYRLPLLAFFLITLTSFGICIGLMSIKLVNDKLEILLKSNETLTVAVFRGEPYPLELIEDSKGCFIYKIEIDVSSSENLSNEELVIYTIDASKRIIKLPSEVSKEPKLSKSIIPAALIVVGSKDFEESVIQSIGYQFEKTEVIRNKNDELTKSVLGSKSVVLVFESEDFEKLEDFLDFLLKFSRKFEMSFILTTNTRFNFPLIIPCEKIPKNVSFIFLKGIKQSFWKIIPYIDDDRDGWIEASEISNAFNGILFYDYLGIPFARAADYPSIDEETLETKLRDLVFKGILNVGDMEKCVELFKRGISPPWLNEYLIGKLKINDLEDRVLYFW